LGEKIVQPNDISKKVNWFGKVNYESAEDYAQDIISRLESHKYKEAARIAMNYRDIVGGFEYQQMMKMVEEEATSYEMRMMYQAISERPRKE
jgi:hypothetical protein